MVKTGCLKFNGYKPCRIHKQNGTHCRECKEYTPAGKKILIIKMQAAGEVIRNTPLLSRLSVEYPDSKIYWLTRFPELIPRNHVYKVLNYDLNSVLYLLNETFDIIYSLDKDIEACSLANMVKSAVKKGYTQKDGVIAPFDRDAEYKWLTGIYDDMMKANTRHYVEEIFEMCGFKWAGEKYILPDFKVPDIKMKSKKKVIGFNTGAGANWVTRKFSKKKVISLTTELMKKHEVVLLGGPAEDVLNRAVAKKTGAKYFGTFPMAEFIGLMSLCDLIITPVTMALHIAIGLGKKIILLNNIFPTNEFYLYGLGNILEPDLDCKYCYKTKFDEKCIKRDCLDSIGNQDVLNCVKTHCRL